MLTNINLYSVTVFSMPLDNTLLLQKLKMTFLQIPFFPAGGTSSQRGNRSSSEEGCKPPSQEASQPGDYRMFDGKVKKKGWLHQLPPKPLASFLNLFMEQIWFISEASDQTIQTILSSSLFCSSILLLSLFPIHRHPLLSQNCICRAQTTWWDREKKKIEPVLISKWILRQATVIYFFKHRWRGKL